VRIGERDRHRTDDDRHAGGVNVEERRGDPQAEAAAVPPCPTKWTNQPGHEQDSALAKMYDSIPDGSMYR
jgi:hypothetical protein